jgi:acyl carrier protein
VDPEDLWALSMQLPYDVDISWSRSGVNGCYDVVFRRHTALGEISVEATPVFTQETNELLPWSSYANNPLQEKLAHVLVPELRRLLKESLPSYMIPSTFVQLKALPLTPNGKLDRAALPSPNKTNVLHDQNIVMPNTPTEALVATIVTSLLHLEQVGIDDNFFMLGGHSLSGVRLIAAVSETFRVDLTLYALFSAPTVRQLSAEIERLIVEKVESMSKIEIQQWLESQSATYHH